MRVHHIDLRQVVPQPCFEVVGIVCRSHLHRTGAEFRIRQFVGDNRDLSIHQRQPDFLPLKMLVALILFVHRDCGIAQHGLRTRGCYRNKFVRPDYRIANLVELACNLFVLHFQIGYGGATTRAPVHNVSAAINQAFVVQPDEHFADRPRKILIHGEVFAIPIH